MNMIRGAYGIITHQVKPAQHPEEVDDRTSTYYELITLFITKTDNIAGRKPANHTDSLVSLTIILYYYGNNTQSTLVFAFHSS